MKILILVIIIIQYLFVNEALAAWPTSKTVRCWSNGDNGSIKMQIAPSGNGFFNVTYIIRDDLGIIEGGGSGTAYIQANTVYIFLTSISDSEYSDIQVNHSYAKLDKISLFGQYKSLLHYVNKDSYDVESTYGEGNENLIPEKCK